MPNKFKFYEPLPRVRIYITASKLIKKQDFTSQQMSFWQNKICKIFKIIPQKMHYYEFRVSVNPADLLNIGDTVLTVDDIQWRVLMEEHGVYSIVNINPTPNNIEMVTGEILRYSSSCAG